MKTDKDLFTDDGQRVIVDNACFEINENGETSNMLDKCANQRSEKTVNAAKTKNASKQKKKSDSSIHAGHRERVRNRFLTSGCSLSGLYEHQVLEMLLFYTNQRNDVNPLAHRILNHFKSISTVLNANVNELLDFGLSPNTAMLIKMINSFPAYIEETQYRGRSFVSVDEVIDFAYTLLGRYYDERICVICLNTDRRLIHYEYLNSGSPEKTDFPLRRVVEIALNHKAASIVMAHNHPSELTTPSANDIACTQMIDRTLHELGISLLEHIVVATPYSFAIKKGYSKYIYKSNEPLDSID